MSSLHPLDPLTAPERRLVAATAAGEICQLDKDETVRAEIVRALVCGDYAAWPAEPEGVRLVGGGITGRLACAERVLARPLWIDEADIPDGIDLTNARTRLLSFDASRVGGAGLRAQGVAVEGPLFLRRTTIRGACNINGATIVGQFVASGATFDNPEGNAIYAQASSIAGMFLDNATLKGVCSINGAAITGQFAANGATFNNPAGDAVNAQASSIVGMFLINATLRGVCRISGATIKSQFSANGATFDNPDGDAINAQASCIGGMFLDKATLKGGCNISGATITGQFMANGAIFDNPSGDAINAQDARIVSVFLDDARLKGVCDINSSTITGQFAADGATFENPYGRAIRADFTRIGSWFMRIGSANGDDPAQQTRLRGTLDLSRATIDRHFEISGADLADLHSALYAAGIEASGAFVIDGGTRIAGGLHLSAAVIRGRLDLTGSHIVSAAQAGDFDSLARIADDATAFTALDLSEARIDQLVMPASSETRPRGIVDLSRARVGTLTDYEAAWPKAADRKARSCEGRFRDGDGRDADHLVLDGFEYEHLDNPDGLPPGQNASPRRLAGIRRDWPHAQSCEDVFHRLRPQPWRHLAKVLVAQGYEDEARSIAIERRVAQRHASGISRPARCLSWLLHALADYGFNPWKAVAWSCGIIFTCALVYGLAAATYCTTASPRCGDGTVFVRTTPADFIHAGVDQKDADRTLADTYPAFDPLSYSFDVFLPLFDVGTERFWRVNTATWRGVALYYFTVLEQIVGALMISLIITGFTGLLTRDEA